LEREIGVQMGAAFTIFQDRRDIAWGDAWRQRIEESIDSVVFLIPIVTPSFFLSEECRSEFERFLTRERLVRRSDLIFPVYYVSCHELDDPAARTDPIAVAIALRQYTDWRGLRFEAYSSPMVASRIADLARQLKAAIIRGGPRPEHNVPAPDKGELDQHAAEQLPGRSRAGAANMDASEALEPRSDLGVVAADDTGVPQSYLENLVPGTLFSPEKVAEFRRQMRKEAAVDMPLELKPAEFLRRAGLLRDGGLTLCGVLLFGDNPTSILPSALVQCVRFHGTTKGDKLESIELRDTVPEIIVRARDFVANLATLGEMPTATGAYAEPTYKYPMLAIREIIANAVVHRDYESQLSCVQIHVFTDRIEIINPGSWGTVPPVAESEYLLGQLSQHSRRCNFRLAQTLTWSRLVEGVGAGLPRALDDCAAGGAPEPTVTVRDGMVTVTIFPYPPAVGSRDNAEPYLPVGLTSRIVNSKNPIFFLSYARGEQRNAGGRLSEGTRRIYRFFNDLSENVAELVSRPVGSVPGYIDVTGARSTRWTSELLEAIGTCQVFVPLLSRPYIESSWCGQEWYAFSRRRVVAHGASRPTGIIPVLWAGPLSDELMPTEIVNSSRFIPEGSFDGIDLAARYESEGVLGLLQTQEELYHAVIWRLAQKIADVFYDCAVDPQIIDPRNLYDVFAADGKR
jgi:hypothetical protein